jgi:hypothetical protein
MTDYTVTLDDSEVKALNCMSLVADPQAFVQNFVSNRARIAIEEVVQLYTSKALDAGIAIPGTRAEIVNDAHARGWIQTAAEQAAANQIPE